MFSKRNLVDVKKSTLKIQDPKKDLATRIKHLKIILDNVDVVDAKGLFEANFSHIYNILYESFVQTEQNLRQKELSFHLVHKAHKEDLECTLWILEQVLCLLPEIINKRWQMHSIGRILSKLLHPGNSIKLRRQAIRYFLMWYQALNDNAPDYVNSMFAAIVPGFNNQSLMPIQLSGSIFHDNTTPVLAPEMLPILPPSGGEKYPEHPSRFFLDALLDHIVHTVSKLEWHDKQALQQRSLQFLLDKFRVFYLSRICPNFSQHTSLYKPNLELPVNRKQEAESEFVYCRVSVILWIASYMNQSKKSHEASQSQMNPQSHHSTAEECCNDTDSTHPSLDSNISLPVTRRSNTSSDEEQASRLMRDTLASSRENVDFLHEIYRQALLMNFTHVIAIRKVIAVYKDLIQANVTDVPVYALEPLGLSEDTGGDTNDPSGGQQQRSARLRTDSYLGAIQKENLLVRAGMQNVLQLFMTHAANVFLLEVNPHIPKILEEQTDACKRVLNIYRYMVMNTRMDSNTWEQLLLVLLQITSLVLGEASASTVQSARKKSQTLGGKLAPAIFQTLIVTWIKANLNVFIDRALWDRFLDVLVALTNWEDLIKEWAKTMETLTRVLARHVYNLDLNNLPLDRLVEQKSRRGRRSAQGTRNGGGASIELGGGGGSAGSGGGGVLLGKNLLDDDDVDDDDDDVDCTLTASGGGGVLKGKKRRVARLSRSYSETSLFDKNKPPNFQSKLSASLDTIHRINDVISTDRTRSPSPAPSSGLNSIKDSPIQLDTPAAPPPSSSTTTNIGTNAVHSIIEQQQQQQLHQIECLRGVICGGTVRGWLPDVAVVLWRRMLGALGDPNAIQDGRLHGQAFEHLVRQTDTLIRIKLNQGVECNGAGGVGGVVLGSVLSSDQTERSAGVEGSCGGDLAPPLTLVMPWCFGALMMSDTYATGRLSALRLMCTVMVNCNEPERFLPQFYLFLHKAFCTNSKAELNTIVKQLGPRFLSLQLPGSTLLLLDLVYACNLVLNCTENLDTSPRTEAVSILANLLSLPNNLNTISVLHQNSNDQQQSQSQQLQQNIEIVPCPDIKEHVVTILLRAGRHEPNSKAKCIALSSIGIFLYKELTNQSFHPKFSEALLVLLSALKYNKTIAQLASNIIYTLCDFAHLFFGLNNTSTFPQQQNQQSAQKQQYPQHLGESIIRTLCSALLMHSHTVQTNEDKALVSDLLLCLGEWCMRIGPKKLLEHNNGGERSKDGGTLLLRVFNVLHKICAGSALIQDGGGQQQQPRADEFDIMPENVELRKSTTTTTTPIMLSKNINSLNHNQKAIVLCAKTVLAHLVTHLGHFPMAIGAARLSSLVVEHDDVPDLVADELSVSIFSVPNIQLFTLTPNVISSLIELPTLELPGGGVTAGLSTSERQVRILLRDQSGKSCWDGSILYRSPPEKHTLPQPHPPTKTNYFTRKNHPPPLTTHRAMRHRSPTILPEKTNAAPDLDQLDDLLQYLGHTSPECLENTECKLNEPSVVPIPGDLEQEIIASVVTQKNIEIDECRSMEMLEQMLGEPIQRPGKEFVSHATYDNFTGYVEQNEFQQCRHLFSQLGYPGWDRRQQVHLLNKTERLLRELRNLDNQRCRESHKVAVIYVAAGQEDKNTILSNEGGSAAYEQFVASLAWEVELEDHTGFLGGLQRQGSNGQTAPYVATSFAEVIFHVATRMPSSGECSTPETVLNKIRHLGNDEVHIVWSEHSRDYRRDIIPTEFCDILIVIYPLGNNLNRVTINCKPDVPNFWILFHEAIVESHILPGLVRAAAICASRAKRTTLPYYQQYYEERALSLDTVMTKHKNSTTFEEFISRVYTPIAAPSVGDSVDNVGSSVGSGRGGSVVTSLAAALLDSNSTNPGKNARHSSDSKYRISASETVRNVWFNNATADTSAAPHEASGISPRPLKKVSVSLRNQPKKTSSPPDSPQPVLRRKL